MRLSFSVLIISSFFSTSFGQNGFIAGFPKLAYWKLGSQPEIIIILHGGPACHHEYLRPELDAIGEHATVIYYDQRGCGKSGQAKSYVWQDHVQDLRRVILNIAPRKKVFLLGSSWGSLLALLYAYKYPQHIKGLILSGTVKWNGKAQPYVRQEPFSPSSPQKFFMRERKLLISKDGNNIVCRDTVNIQKILEGTIGTQLSETLSSLISAPIADSLGRIRIPILIAKGMLNQEKNKPLYDWVDEYMKLLPNVTLRTFEVAKHDPWFSDPKKFAGYTSEFINNYK